MIKTIIIIFAIMLFEGCNIKSDNTNKVSYIKSSPVLITSTKIYKFEISKDDFHYFKYIPNETGYYSILLGKETNNNISIELYLDKNYENKIYESYTSNYSGDYINYKMKKDVAYYVKIIQDNTNYFAYYNLLISKSNKNNIFTKDIPLVINLNKDNINLVSTINYDNFLISTDDGNELIYMIINSKLTKQLSLKTMILRNHQDIDFVVYSDNNYTNEIYTTSSTSITNESLKISFETNTSYYIKIQNFTNTSESLIKLSIE